MLRLAFITLSLATSVSGRASSLNAASPAFSDVSAAIKSASDGDTVVLPAGTATWTTTLQVSKAITLQGATTVSGDHTTTMSATDVTVITDGVSKTASSQACLLVSVAPGKLFRLTGITFQGGNGGTGTGGSVQLYGNMNSSNVLAQFRVDHCHFHLMNDLNLLTDTFAGVVDHCLFDLSTGVNNGSPNSMNNGVHVKHSKWNGSTIAGDGSWADYPNLGSGQAIFLEDNTFNNGFADDCNAGGRIVLRYNVLNNGIMQNHRAAGRERASRTTEVYNNTFTWSEPSGANSSFVVMLTAGTGVIWGNTTNGYYYLVSAVNQRSDRNDLPFGQATGSNAWDQNSDQYGYACIGQIGRGKGDLITGNTPVNSTTGTAAWPHEAAEPFYEWANNYHKPINSSGQVWGGNEGEAVLKQNRDFYLNTQLPGYTPYTYPHPLALQPQHLRVVP